MIRVQLISTDPEESRHFVVDIAGDGGLKSGADVAPLSDTHKVIALSKPDVVVMDLPKPDRRALRVLRSLLERYPIPVVVLSSFPAADRLNFLREGAVTVLGRNWIDGRELCRNIKVFAGLKIVRRVPSVPREKAERNFLLIAASSGGPSVVKELLKGTPPRPDLSAVLVQHISAQSQSSLVEWLGKETDWKVRLCAEPTRPEGGCLYLGSAGEDLILLNGCLVTTPSEEPIGFAPSADQLFSSFAMHESSNIVAVILSGMGNDGAAGMLALRNAGALTIAQCPEEAKVSGMPQSAIDMKAAVMVVPSDQIPPRINQFLKSRAD